MTKQDENEGFDGLESYLSSAGVVTRSNADIRQKLAVQNVADSILANLLQAQQYLRMLEIYL